MNEVRLKPFRVSTAWTIKWNKFMDLEPDNDLPIDDVWINFEEDISYFICDDYFIDLGFYGNYLEGRKGTFKLYVAKGNFTEGKLYEYFSSRSTEEIAIKIEDYMALISNGKIKKIKGLKYGTDTDISDRIYSAIDSSNIKIR